MSTDYTGKNQRLLLKGLGKTGIWFIVSRLSQIAAAVWVTRILGPDDFAILAVIFAIQGFIQQLTAINFSSELIRSHTLSREDIDCAWSYEVIRNVIVWLLLYLCAPLASDLLGQPEACAGLRIASFGMLIACLRNPRLVELRRDGKFGQLGWIESIPLLTYALFSVVFVIWQKNYYSLIYAGVAASFCGVILPLFTLPWRPKFNFETTRIKPMFRFGMILLLETGLAALREHGMVFIVIASTFAKDLGYLNRGIAFSVALSLQAVSIFWRVAYPHYAALQRNGGYVAHDAVTASRWLLVLGLPSALLMAYFSDPIISFALGDKWQPVADVWVWLLLAGTFMLANAPLEAALQALRHEKKQIYISILTTMISLGFAFVLLPIHGIVGVGVSILLSSITASFLLRISIARATSQALATAQHNSL